MRRARPSTSSLRSRSRACPPSTVAAVIRRPMVVGDVLDAVHRIVGPGAGRPLLSMVRGEIGP
jgi:hypothetical protein